ncbi:MAG: undecaprenyl-diphosphate phosphatase [Microgenomates group bacterium]
MNILNSLFLGAVQGLTEFLPVSSSAHLVILQKLIPSFSQPGVLFDTVLHLGTLFAVLFYFRKELFAISFSYLKYIIIGTIPAVLVGFLFSDFLESLFSNIKLVGLALFLTAIFNFLSDKMSDVRGSLNLKKSFLIGVFQALAITPGISRSGSTIFGGILTGVKKEDAAKFSFLLSVPAIIGALSLQVYKYGANLEANYSFYFFGFLSSFVFGFLSIKLVFRFLLSSRFKIFGYYCLILGFLALLI